MNWKVSDEPSLSDHRQISFSLIALANRIKRGPNRNPGNTNWTSFTEELGGGGEQVSAQVWERVEHAV